MTLAWKPVERALRRRVRGELRGSREQWREYRRNTRSRPRHHSIEPWLRILVPLGLACLAAAGPHAPGLVLLGTALYGTGSAFLRARDLLRGLYASPDLYVLSHFPVSDEELLRLQWKRFHRGTLWVLWAFAAVYLALAAKEGTAAALAVAAGLAVAQWFCVLGVSSALAAWKPAWPLGFVGNLLCGLVLAPLVLGKTLGPRLEEASGLGLLAFPAGWATFALRNGLLMGQDAAYLAALPAAALVALFPLAARRLLRGYAVGELVFRAPPPAEQLLEEIVRGERADEVRRAIPDLVEERILEGAFLRRPPWTSGGFLERAFAALLSPRDLAAADFLLGGAMAWSKSWKLSAASALAGSGLVLLLGAGHAWAVSLTAIAMTLFLLAGTWPGFRTVPCGGSFAAHHGLYPIGFWQASSILFRAALVRILAWLPLAAGFALVAGLRGYAAPDGLAIVPKAAAALLAWVPVSTLFRFSGGTNDTDRVRFVRFLVLMLPCALLVGAGLVGGAALFAFPIVESWPAFGLLLLPPYLAWLLYGANFNRGRIDLVRTSAPSVVE